MKAIPLATTSILHKGNSMPIDIATILFAFGIFALTLENYIVAVAAWGLAFFIVS